MSSLRDEHLEYQGVVVPVMRYLNSLPHAKAVNVHGSVFSERGTPDVIGCVGGRMVAFECKRSADGGSASGSGPGPWSGRSPAWRTWT